MKLYLFSYYNTVGSFFGQLQCCTYDKATQVEVLKQALHRASVKDLESCIEDDLYFMGTLDTETGVIVPEKEFVLHLGDEAKRLLMVKHQESEDIKNVKEN